MGPGCADPERVALSRPIGAAEPRSLSSLWRFLSVKMGSSLLAGPIFKDVKVFCQPATRVGVVNCVESIFNSNNVRWSGKLYSGLLQL